MKRLPGNFFHGCWRKFSRGGETVPIFSVWKPVHNMCLAGAYKQTRHSTHIAACLSCTWLFSPHCTRLQFARSLFEYPRFNVPLDRRLSDMRRKSFVYTVRSVYNPCSEIFFEPELEFHLEFFDSSNDLVVFKGEQSTLIEKRCFTQHFSFKSLSQVLSFTTFILSFRNFRISNLQIRRFQDF